MKRIPHMCITCKHFDPYHRLLNDGYVGYLDRTDFKSYHCLLNDCYIGYLDCAEPTKCRAWELSDDYKKGGKFYEKEKAGD